MEELSLFQQAYFKWARAPTKCDCIAHFITDGRGKTTSIPYHKVCEREQAWRDYTAVRDGELNGKQNDRT